ncbi:MAG: VWA domain-containing protein [Gemmatimonadetes bacterium]|nr:VWA domain-containing protein [Gemmatimonadota bacterium]
MLVTVVALAATGFALALYLLIERVGRAGLPLALLRAAAWGGVAVLLVNPGCQRSGGGGTAVLLDGSLSMTDPVGDARWRAALDTARAIAGRSGRIVLFGEEPRIFMEGATPSAAESSLLPALREAASRGGRLVIVTDGVLDDATAIPLDLLRRARIVVLPRPAGPDAGIAGFDLPVALRAGDSATATVDVVAAATRPGDSVTIELLEQGRVVASARVGVGGGGSYRRDLSFVPAAPAPERELRRYEARVSGIVGDREPRDDRRTSLAAVTRAGAIVLLSDSPDWDSRWLASTLTGTSGVPVQVFVRVANGGWRDARTLRPVGDAAVQGAAQRATLVVAHGSEAGVDAVARLARRALWRWPTQRRDRSGAPGDWYVMAPEFASPVGAAFAGVPAESLPPLEGVDEVRSDSVAWTGLTAQLDRRGRSRPVVQGALTGRRHVVTLSATGLWRWASRGGVAGEAYRALVASLTDWLLEERGGEHATLVAARDSLARGAAEFLPRAPVLTSQPGLAAVAARDPVPLRHVTWAYWAALVALVAEWIARRRVGLR